MTGEVQTIETVVAGRYAELLDEARRAWLAVGILVTVEADLRVRLTDAVDSTLVYALLTGGLYFGLSCYLEELLDEPSFDVSQIRTDLLSAL